MDTLLEFRFDLQRFADDPGNSSGNSSGNDSGVDHANDEPKDKDGAVKGDDQKPTDTKPTDTQDDSKSGEPGGDDNGLNDVSALRKELERVRREAAKYRTERKQLSEEFEALKKRMAQALGLASEDTPADPDKLAKELEQIRTKYRLERSRNAVFAAATKAGADPELTWAMLYASGAIGNLDVDDEGFTEAIAERVQEALKAHPNLKVAQKPGVGSNTNPSGGDGNAPPAVYTRSKLASMSYDEINRNWDEIRRQLQAGLIK